MREGCRTDESGASRVDEILPARSLPIQLESPMFTSPTARDHKMAECFSPTSYRPSSLPSAADLVCQSRGRKAVTSAVSRRYSPGLHAARSRRDAIADFTLDTFTLDRPAETRVRGLLIKRHASRFAHRFTSRHYSIVDTGLI